MTRDDFQIQDLSDFLLLNADFSTDNSLQSGKLAVALFFFYAKRHDLISVHPDIGDSYLTEIYLEPQAFQSVTYATGILGAGVVMEHLVQNELAGQDITSFAKVLVPLLDRVTANMAHIVDIGIAHGHCGAGIYLLYRLQNTAISGGIPMNAYEEQVSACAERIVKLFPSYRPNEYVHQADASIWNGLAGVLLFLTKVNTSGLGTWDSENLEKDIAERLMQQVNTDPFRWSKAEVFIGLLNCSAVSKNKIWHDRIWEDFNLFVRAGPQHLQSIDPANAAFIGVLIRLLGKKYNHDPAFTLSEAINLKVMAILAEEDISDLFHYDQESQSFQMGLYRGLCGTALSLLSLQTGDYSWLEILGIRID